MRGAIAIGVVAAILGGAGWSQPAPGDPLPALPRATRGPRQVVFRPDGRQVAVPEADTGTLALIDASSRAVTVRHATGGREPVAAAWLKSDLVLVAHRFGGLVTLLNTATGRLEARRELLGEPSDVVVSRDGSRAYVALGQLNQVAVLRVPGLEIEARVPVGSRPRSLALSPDGRRLLAANLQGGTVSEVDLASGRELRQIPVTGVNLRDVQYSADGHRAVVTGQIASNTRVTRDTLDIWTNTLFLLHLQPDARPASSEGWLDFSRSPSSDPDGVAVLGPEHAAVVLSGSDEVLRVRTPGPHLRSYDPVIERRAQVGARPRGITVSPDGRSLWVACELDSTVWVLDAATLARTGVVNLGTPPGLDHRMPGRYLFGSSRLTAGGQFSCNSCHPDGNSDGLAWEFTHVDDGVVKRNSRNLRGGIVQTAPYRWSGRERDIEEFFQDEVTGLLRGPRQPHSVLHALWNFVDLFPMPPNPHRAPGDQLTPQAARGKALFQGKAGCASCHDGPLAGGSGKKADVGTVPDGPALDVPHLHGVFDTAPYLHHARARTLEDVFTRFNEEKRHGAAHRLNSAEFTDLIRYLQEL